MVSKEEAQKKFEEYFKGKKLLPNIFKQDNQIAEMRKLYVPYWLCDCDAQGDIVAYHFDFYRLKSMAEAIDMGAEDYFYSGAYCFLEWPELVEDLLPEDTLHVSLTEQADGTRLIEF